MWPVFVSQPIPARVGPAPTTKLVSLASASPAVAAAARTVWCVLPMSVLRLAEAVAAARASALLVSASRLETMDVLAARAVVSPASASTPTSSKTAYRLIAQAGGGRLLAASRLCTRMSQPNHGLTHGPQVRSRSCSGRPGRSWSRRGSTSVPRVLPTREHEGTQAKTVGIMLDSGRRAQGVRVVAHAR